ncbi:MAG: 3-hydroxyacyl-CoA dehydrogenase family protein [Gemmatimonadetes bacterium]|nr:3-hydroxyacyl-CoA dehydrogenase family protein [Gemmatimonadota bacterium]
MPDTKTPVRTVAIVGAGTMGRRIAYGCVIQRVEARVYDEMPSAITDAVGAVRSLVAERVARGNLEARGVGDAQACLIPCSTLRDCVAQADWIIETVPEDLELKRRVLNEIRRFAAEDAYIATNSSSIPGSWLAESTGRPERFINMNFGAPDHLKVEVMGHPTTAPETTAAARAFLRQLGLVPVVAQREIQGYPTNRVWRAVKKEVLQLLDGGYSTPEDIDRGWMLDWHTPIGPCGLMDVVGLDVVRDIEMIYYNASGDPSDKPPQLLHDMITAGKLGVKSGEGFYTHPNPAYERPGWLTGDDS